MQDRRRIRLEVHHQPAQNSLHYFRQRPSIIRMTACIINNRRIFDRAEIAARPARYNVGSYCVERSRSGSRCVHVRLRDSGARGGRARSPVSSAGLAKPSRGRGEEAEEHRVNGLPFCGLRPGVFHRRSECEPAVSYRRSGREARSTTSRELPSPSCFVPRPLNTARNRTPRKLRTRPGTEPRRRSWIPLAAIIREMCDRGRVDNAIQFQACPSLSPSAWDHGGNTVTG